MNRRLLFSVIAIIGLLLNKSHAATPLESHLHLQARSEYGATILVDLDQVSQLGTINTLHVEVEAMIVNGADMIRTFGEGTATWNNPASGYLTFVAGFEMLDNDPNVYSRTETRPGSEGWRYTFSPNVDGQFVLNYKVAFDGTNVAGLNGFFVYFDGVQLAPGQFDPGGSPGTVTAQTHAFSTHTIEVIPHNSISGDLRNRYAIMTSEFDWQFTNVPEPSILSLAIIACAGSLLIGLRNKLRR